MTILYLMGSFIAGFLIAWFASRLWAMSSYTKQMTDMKEELSSKISELEGRAKSAEAITSELREQVRGREGELAGLRSDLARERQDKVEALTRLEAAQKGFEEQKALLEAMKGEMTDTFNALSSAALKSSSEDFLRLATESLGKVAAETGGRLGEHKAALDGMIKPLSDALKKYDEQIQTMEQSRHKAYGSLEEQLRSLASTHENLQKETSNLVSALRRPEVRGRWGEMQLRRVAELSGMAEHCDFEEQVSVETEQGRLRPDMTVKLPGSRMIVVDSKVSLAAYLEAVASGTDEERKAKLVKHGQQVRQHMVRLSSTEYWRQFSDSPEFVILFIPGESFLSAALDSDPTLIEDGIQKRVIIATPTTFIALLRAIAYGWRQEQVTKNAQQIGMLGKELYDRMSTVAKHFNEMGTAIERSVSSYNRIVGSMESRVLPSIRKFRDLGVTAPDEIQVIEQVDQKTRTLSLLDPE
jgi:DNA recombination protein RmuC